MILAEGIWSCLVSFYVGEMCLEYASFDLYSEESPNDVSLVCDHLDYGSSVLVTFDLWSVCCPFVVGIDLETGSDCYFFEEEISHGMSYEAFWVVTGHCHYVYDWQSGIWNAPFASWEGMGRHHVSWVDCSRENPCPAFEQAINPHRSYSYFLSLVEIDRDWHVFLVSVEMHHCPFYFYVEDSHHCPFFSFLVASRQSLVV